MSKEKEIDYEVLQTQLARQKESFLRRLARFVENRDKKDFTSLIAQKQFLDGMSVVLSDLGVFSDDEFDMILEELSY